MGLDLEFRLIHGVGFQIRAPMGWTWCSISMAASASARPSASFCCSSSASADAAGRGLLDLSLKANILVTAVYGSFVPVLDGENLHTPMLPSVWAPDARQAVDAPDLNAGRATPAAPAPAMLNFAPGQLPQDTFYGGGLGSSIAKSDLMDHDHDHEEGTHEGSSKGKNTG
ncbi:hypothetical protein VPH35_061662 [Triticum aestivum]|uniref:Uncharacterized protein n=1 Tax=Aegilops tauschii TaxID=37682 RepID=M8B916_AEGTA